MKRKFFTRVGAAVLTAAMLLTGLPEGTALAGTKTSAAVSSPAAVTESAEAETDSGASASSAPTTVSDVTVNDDGQYEATISNAKVMDANGTETTFNLRLVSDTDDTTKSDFVSATQEVAGTADSDGSVGASASSSDSTDDTANTGSVILIPGMTADDLKEAAQAEAKEEITSESVSDALSTNVHAASVGESVTLNVGNVVKLNTGHGTHRFTVTDASGSSYYAYCLEPSLAAPAETGHSASEQIKKVITNKSTNDNDLTLLYCAYYLYGGPGWGQPNTSVSGGTFDPGQKDQDSYNYLLTHEILSVAFANGSQSVIKDVGDPGTVTGVMNWYNSIKAHKGEDGTFPAVPDSYTFCVLYNDKPVQHMSYGSVRARIVVPIQKVDSQTLEPVKQAGFTFTAYMHQGDFKSTNPSDYGTPIGTVTTDPNGQASIVTGWVGSAASNYTNWLAANRTWTFLIQETGTPNGGKYGLNSSPLRYAFTFNPAGNSYLSPYQQESNHPWMFYAPDGRIKYGDPKRGRVAINLQKTDAATGKAVNLAGFTFDAYYTQGATTSKNPSDYTLLKAGMPTNASGQIGIATGYVGTAKDTYAEWVKANPTWTFLVIEKSVPEGSGYTLNQTRMTYTVDLTKATADKTTAGLYWGKDTVNFANTKQVQGKVGIKIQKKDADTGKDVKLAGITFDAYYAAGSTSSTTLSDYTKIGTVKTDANGQASVQTGDVGTAADTYADWVKANPKWTFLLKETALPAGSGYTLNTKPLIVTVDTAKATADPKDAGLYWGNTAEFTNTKQIKGHVGVKLQKTDASTGKDVKLAGITFDTYYMEGESTSTDTSKYTKLGTVTTDANGKADIKTDQVGTAADTYADWVKANPKWTFLVVEKSVPADSGYMLNQTPMTITVDLTKGKADAGDESLYWGADTMKFANKQTPPPTTTPPAPKTPTIKTTATSSGSHDVMLNEKTLDSTTVTINDVIELANLESGTTYMIKGELHNAETGNQITTAKASDITFKATGDTSTQTMTFTVPAKDVANVKTVVYETLYREEKGKFNPATSEKNAKEAAQTVSFTTPGLSTSAKSGTTGKQQADALSTKETVVDTVKYTALQTGKSYTVKGTLMLKASDTDTKGTAIATAEKTFTPDTADGSIDLTFTYDATKYVGKTVVAFEELQQGGVTIATHKDLTDTAQSVYIPSIGTKASGTDTGIDHQVAENGKTITDTVSYTNLLPETTYKLAGTLVNKATGKEALTADASFTTGKAASGAATVSGTADVVFKITDADAMAGTTFVAYETLSLGDTAIAEHKDLTDAGQTVYLPKVETQVKSDTTSTQAQFAAKDTKITDTVNMSGLKSGQTYVIKGTLMDKATGKAVSNVTAAPTEVKFTASAATSTQTIQYTFDSTNLEGHTVVVFEDLYAVDSTGKETLVGKEEDLQSKTQAMLLTPHGPTLYAGGTGTRWIYVAGIGLAAVAVILVVLLRKKRKPNA